MNYKINAKSIKKHLILSNFQNVITFYLDVSLDHLSTNQLLGQGNQSLCTETWRGHPLELEQNQETKQSLVEIQPPLRL